MTIKAVVFDIGGVLVRTLDWSHRSLWEHRLGLPDRGLSTLVFDSEAARLASTGRADDNEIWHYVADHLGLTDMQLSQVRRDFWAGDSPNTEFIAFIRNLRSACKTGILSNAWPEMQRLNEGRFGLLDAVDQTLYSFQIGVLKPASEAYEAIVNGLSVESNQTVFIDDSAVNIDGARQYGLRAIHFTTTEGAVAELKRLLAEG